MKKRAISFLWIICFCFVIMCTSEQSSVTDEQLYTIVQKFADDQLVTEAEYEILLNEIHRLEFAIPVFIAKYLRNPFIYEDELIELMVKINTDEAIFGLGKMLQHRDEYRQRDVAIALESFSQERLEKLCLKKIQGSIADVKIALGVFQFIEVTEVSINQIADCLKNSDKIIKLSAIQALENKKKFAEKAISLLVSSLQETNDECLEQVIWSLCSYGASAKKALPRLLALYDETIDTKIKTALLSTCTEIDAQDEGVQNLVLQALEDANPKIVSSAVTQLEHHKYLDAKYVKPLVAAAEKHSDESITKGAVRVLRQYGADAVPAIPFLIKLLKHEDHYVKMCVYETFGLMGDAAEPAFAEIMIAHFDDHMSYDHIEPILKTMKEHKQAVDIFIRLLKKLNSHYANVDDDGSTFSRLYDPGFRFIDGGYIPASTYKDAVFFIQKFFAEAPLESFSHFEADIDILYTSKLYFIHNIAEKFFVRQGEKSLPKVISFLNHSDPEVKICALWNLGDEVYKNRRESIFFEVKNVMKNASDEFAMTSLRSLKSLQFFDEQLTQRLLTLYKTTSSEEIKTSILQYLSFDQGNKQLAHDIAMLIESDQDIYSRENLIDAFGQIGVADEHGISMLWKQFEEDQREINSIRASVYQAFAGLGDAGAQELLKILQLCEEERKKYPQAAEPVNSSYSGARDDILIPWSSERTILKNMLDAAQLDIKEKEMSIQAPLADKEVKNKYGQRDTLICYLAETGSLQVVSILVEDLKSDDKDISSAAVFALLNLFKKRDGQKIDAFDFWNFDFNKEYIGIVKTFLEEEDFGVFQKRFEELQKK